VRVSSAPPARPSNPRIEISQVAFRLAQNPACRAAGRCVCEEGCTGRAFEAAASAIRNFDAREAMKDTVRRMRFVLGIPR